MNNKLPKTTEIRSAPTGGDFTLLGITGPLKLSETPSPYKIIFAGYTHCPHYCPNILKKLSDLRKSMTPDENNKFTVVFISVDPERDQPSQIQSFVNRFGANVIAMTGDHANLTAILNSLGGFYRRLEPLENGDYGVDHSTELFITDGAGKMLGTINPNTDVQEIALKLAQLMQGNPSK